MQEASNINNVHSSNVNDIQTQNTAGCLRKCDVQIQGKLNN